MAQWQRIKSAQLVKHESSSSEIIPVELLPRVLLISNFPRYIEKNDISLHTKYIGGR